MSESSKMYKTKSGRESRIPRRFVNSQPEAPPAPTAIEPSEITPESHHTPEDSPLVVYPTDEGTDADPEGGDDVHGRREREAAWEQRVRDSVYIHNGEYEVDDASELLDSAHSVNDILAILATMHPDPEDANPNSESERLSVDTDSDGEEPVEIIEISPENPTTAEQSDTLFMSPPVAPTTREPRIPGWLPEQAALHRRAREREASIISSMEGAPGPAPSINVGGHGSPIRPFRLFGVSDQGSPTYLWRNRTAPRPRVLVPGTPDDSDTEDSMEAVSRRGKQRPLPPLPWSAQPVPPEPAQQTQESSTRWGAMLKPVGSWMAGITESARRLADNTAANRRTASLTQHLLGQSVAPTRNQTGPRTKPKEPSSEDAYDDPVLNTAMAEYTSQRKTGPMIESDSDVSLSNRIPAAAKGKQRAVRFDETPPEPEPEENLESLDPRAAQIAHDAEIALRLQTDLEAKADKPRKAHPKLKIDVASVQDVEITRIKAQEDRKRDLEAEILKEDAERSTIANDIQNLKSQLAQLEAKEKDKKSEIRRKKIVRALEESFKNEPESPAIPAKPTQTIFTKPSAKNAISSELRRQHIIKGLEESYRKVPSTTQPKAISPNKAATRDDKSIPPSMRREKREATALAALTSKPEDEKISELNKQLKKYLAGTGRKAWGTAGPRAQQASSVLTTIRSTPSATAETIGKTPETLKVTPSTLEEDGEGPSDPNSSDDSSESSSDDSDKDSDSTLGTTSEDSSKKKKSRKSKRAKEASAIKKEKRRIEKYLKRLRKQRKEGQKALRYNKPPIYSGEPSYDKFEAWIEDIEDWQEANDLSEYAVVTSTAQLVGKSAKEWYRTHVSKRETEWTFKQLTDGIFDDSFPTNYASVMRRSFETATQGSFSVKKWYRYLTRLSKRVALLSIHDITRAFWKGSAEYLQVKWAEEGWDPEDQLLTIEMLYESALRFERAREWQKAEKYQSDRHKGGQGQRNAQTANPKENHSKGQNQNEKSNQGKAPPNKAGTTNQQGGKRNDKSANTDRPAGGRDSKGKILSEDDKAKYRAEGRCFFCSEKGHDQRNCPKRRELKPSTSEGSKKPVYGGSLRPEGVRTKKGATTPVIRLNMIEPLTSNGVMASVIRKREEDERTLRLSEARERHKCVMTIAREFFARQLRKVEPVAEWQRHLPCKEFRFEIDCEAEGVFIVRDTWRSWEAEITLEELSSPTFDAKKWASEMNDSAPITLHKYQEEKARCADMKAENEESGNESSDDSDSESETTHLPNSDTDEDELETQSLQGSSVAGTTSGPDVSDNGEGDEGKYHSPILCAMAKPKVRTKPKSKAWESLEDNSARIRDEKRVMPHPIILTVFINGKAARALLDCGAFSDFVSTSLVDNLGLKRETLTDPLTLQMAVQGSKSKINAQTTVNFEYSTIKCQKTFDVINIAHYDLILGTPFFYQHSIIAGMNPTRIAIGSNAPQPINGEDVHTILGANAIEMEDRIQEIRDMLTKEAGELCEDTSTSALPPFRAINHHIPLIDDNKVYKYRPSKCPRALEPQWREKSNEYLSTGRWRMATGMNPIPILLIQKPRKTPNEPVRLRACFDKREQNANTRKLASPLPDQTEVLERIAAHKYRSVLDGRDAYEQIRVVDEDVWKTLFNSPSGTMVSLVLQQGDCNGPATYQNLMNHIFAPYIGVWMDVYLDDIMVYSDTLEEHIEHIRTVLSILRREKLFLNPKKMQFLAEELVVLGHRITDEGIKMDPHKVDSISKWPTPSNKGLLSSFIGAVGYLADGVRSIRIPMAILNKLTGSNAIWRWGPTEARAFEKIKDLVEEYRNKTRVPISYEPNAPRLWLVTDASMTGAAGHVCQGDDWKTAKPVAFWSGKFTSAEQAYRTHEQELLAIVASLKRFRHHLLGTRFTIVTDHERIESLHTQKDLNRRQIRWMETLSDFDFDVLWVEGKSNVFADALSRLYSNDQAGVERAASEYVNNLRNEDEDDSLGLFNIEPSLLPSRPIIIGNEVTEEMEAFMAQPAIARRNVPRNKGRVLNLIENDTESSGESELSDEQKPAVIPKKAKGRPRKSVIAPIIKPSELIPGGPTSAAPSSRRAEPAYSKRTPNEPTGISDEGESEIDSPEESSQSEPSKRVEYRKMVERKAQTVKTNEDFDPEDEGESEMESEVDEMQQKSARELLEINREIEEEHLPELRNGSGSLENAVNVQLTDVITEVDLPRDLEGRYGEDAFFALVLQDPLHYANFEVQGEPGKELVFIKDSERRTICIPDVKIGSRKAREIVITHAHSILAHLGTRKTLWYLRDNVWWKDMIKDVADYCTSCEICARTKPTNQKPMGLLHPLKVPTRPWEQIGVDFVGPLPEAKNRYGAFDQIMVVIDHLTSMTHLIPTKITYRARQVAEVFYESVYKLHGLPERIISDRDKIFTSIFWKSLHKLMRIELKLSSSYHPQTDGATERANRTMVQMVRNAIGDKDSRWLHRLPAIEWAMNAARSETTGFSPFFLNYGYRPRPLLWNNATKEEYPGVHAFAQKMKEAIMKAHDAILEKRVKQTRAANKSRRPAKLNDGDKVYLSTRNLKLPKGKTRKLVPKYIGPYAIIKTLVPGTTYKLNLPDELKSRGINNSFHAELLRPYIPNCDTRFPGRQFHQLAVFGGDTDEWEVARIASHSGSGRETLFQVEWSNETTTWEPHHRVKELEALTEYLEAMGVKSISQLPKGTGQPPLDDPETFLGMLQVAVRSEEEDLKAEREPLPTPSTFPPSFLFEIPIPPSESTISIMARNNSRYHTHQKEGSDAFNVTRTRQGSPFPYKRQQRLGDPAIITSEEEDDNTNNQARRPSHRYPTVPKPRQQKNDALETAIDVACAATTPDVAKEIRAAAGRAANTPSRRERIVRQIRSDPRQFFGIIGMQNILRRTTASAGTRSAGPIRNARYSANAASAPKPMLDVNEAMIALLTELLNVTNANTAIIRNHFSEPASATTSSAEDPRTCVSLPSTQLADPFQGIFDPATTADAIMDDNTTDAIDYPDFELLGIAEAGIDLNETTSTQSNNATSA